jgi:hypothetical protein
VVVSFKCASLLLVFLSSPLSTLVHTSASRESTGRRFNIRQDVKKNVVLTLSQPVDMRIEIEALPLPPKLRVRLQHC